MRAMYWSWIGLGLVASSPAAADGGTDYSWAGTPGWCPTSSAGSVFEPQNFVPAGSPGKLDGVEFGPDSSGDVAVGSFCRTGAECATSLSADSWMIGDLLCTGGSYTLHLEPFAEGDCDPGFAAAWLEARSIRIGEPGVFGDLLITGETPTGATGAISSAEPIVVAHGSFSSRGASLTAPAIELAGIDCAVSIENAPTFVIDDMLFGHVDGAEHHVTLSQVSLPLLRAISVSGVESWLDLDLAGGSLFCDGFSVDGAGAMCAVHATNGGYFSCNGDFASGDSGGELCAMDGGQYLVIGTYTLNDGWIGRISGAGSVGDCDQYVLNAGARMTVSDGGTMIAFFSPTRVKADARLTVTSATHDGDVSLLGGILALGNADILGQLFATAGTFLVDTEGARVDEVTMDDFAIWKQNFGEMPSRVMGDGPDDSSFESGRAGVPQPPARPGETGQLVVTNTATLAGALRVDLFGSVSAGDEAVILSAASVKGTFASVEDGWHVEYTPTQVTLVADQDMTGGSTPGDVTGDGVVDTGDLLALLAAWGACDDPSDCPADLDGDGSVGVSDLLLVLSNWS